MSSKARLAVLSFVWEGDRELAFDTFDSIVRSCPSVDIDFFFTDDASPSFVGEALVRWCRDRGYVAHCIRYETKMGYRGAIDRTLSLLREVARSQGPYDLVLRIDTDALVVRGGIAAALTTQCTDAKGLYGVTRRMRKRDAVALLLDLVPLGLRRARHDGSVVHSYSLRRARPVWWWKVGFKALAKGFRFKFADGCCYVMGGDVAGVLNDAGYLDLYRGDRYGLITSEEDVIITMMCHARGLEVHSLAELDATWSQMSWIGDKVLSTPVELLPFVVHPLIATPEGLALRAKVRKSLPLFVES